jgi:hypothetical protein
MDPTGERAIATLFWIVLVSLAAVIAAVVKLVRSGRAVPLPMIRMRPSRRQRLQ